ncbi:DUF2207 domain-containing protein [Candidatus Dojkabacteria bacterium]|uniref:DUF2207 domain-containing protein n=1 Tax=Candidatus Dojkabacteria bacterium TaxID=2099670 RepID=A0A955RKF4_9BACT|nr:DUF2207 domain-containing protein [Candidatus Dojkabacteria bacterium]
MSKFSTITRLIALPIAFIGMVQISFAQDLDRSYVFDSYNVDITINEDTSMDITEELTYDFDGTYRGVFRDITLEDSYTTSQCQDDPSLQCGGFDEIVVTEVRGNEGELLDPSQYTVEETYEGYERRLRITWLFSDEGIAFSDDDLFTFTITYEITGGFGFFDEYDFFYWDVLPPDRDVNIVSADIDIRFPQDVNFVKEDLGVWATNSNTFYDYAYDPNTFVLNIVTQDIVPDNDFTIGYKIPKGILREPGSIRVRNEGMVPNSPEYYLNGDRVYPSFDLIDNVPADVSHTLEIKNFGYKTQAYDLMVSPGEEYDLEFSMTPTIPMYILLILIGCLNALALPAIPGVIIWLYFLWNRKGKDKQEKTTVVPEFDPPSSIPPYLIGALQDEKVDMVDITSVLIDVAYRGYIKIIEIERKGILSGSTEYEFQKLRSFEDLSSVEQKILTAVFKYKDKVSTKQLQNKFYRQIPDIKNAIYDEMVEKNYFEKRPDKVRSSYFLKGIGVFFLGIVILTFVSFAIIELTDGFWGIPLVQCVVVILGIGLFALAHFMPAKTSEGGEIARRFKGFKMFLHHAERYRLQNLKPDMFEKFLSYAVVFGVEESWADAFKDIYKGSPDWFEGNGDFSTVHFANSMSRLVRTTNASMTSTPSSSGSGSSYSGGGFSSGGGGFSGGFSGGGGGGGGAGAF